MGRTQELLYFIREIKERGLVTGHGDWPVYIDSPLAIEATGIFLQCDTQFLDEDMQALIRSGVNPIYFSGLTPAVSKEESQAINEDRTPKVILSASGMCDAGRIRHHLKHNLWRPECRVLFVGYQAEGTLGRLLLDGAKKVKLFNEEIEVNAVIDTLPGVSGHADKAGLIRWLGGFETKPELIFVNHGDLCALQRHPLRSVARGIRSYRPAPAHHRPGGEGTLLQGRAALCRAGRGGGAAAGRVPQNGGTPQQGAAALHRRNQCPDRADGKIILVDFRRFFVDITLSLC